MNATDVRDRKVVVIGGSSGIGLAVAKAAIGAGATVVIGSSKATNVDAAVQQLGDRAKGYAVDVTDEAGVEAFFTRAGSFDHLVFTAGDWGAPPFDWDIGRAQASSAVRFWGALTAIKYGRDAISEHGSITLTNGAVAHRPRRGTAVGSAMAGAIEHLVRGLAIDLAPVRVNAVCPGIVLTGIWDTFSEEQLRQMTKRLPLPRGADPAEVAEAYLYLMRGTYTTGQVLRVDGGYTLI
jgi:NAD(P)-dependent dehydrogenase (short-subunit alcohol dehydrogenase family)